MTEKSFQRKTRRLCQNICEVALPAPEFHKKDRQFAVSELYDDMIEYHLAHPNITITSLKKRFMDEQLLSQYRIHQIKKIILFCCFFAMICCIIAILFPILFGEYWFDNSPNTTIIYNYRTK